MGRSIVAEFHKPGHGRRLELFSLTSLENVKGSDGRIFVDRRTYDVELSRKYGYLFHESGAGGGRHPVRVEGIYFVSGDVDVKEQRSCLVNRRVRALNKTRRLRRLPPSFRGQGGDLLDWLRANGIEQDAIYCSDCRDWFPGDSLCDHCAFCDKVHWYSTPGEPCGCSPDEAQQFHCR